MACTYCPCQVLKEHPITIQLSSSATSRKAPSYIQLAIMRTYQNYCTFIQYWVLLNLAFIIGTLYTSVVDILSRDNANINAHCKSMPASIPRLDDLSNCNICARQFMDINMKKKSSTWGSHGYEVLAISLFEPRHTSVGDQFSPSASHLSTDSVQSVNTLQWS